MTVSGSDCNDGPDAGAESGRPNQVEAVRANLEKRTPRFADPE